MTAGAASAIFHRAARVGKRGKEGKSRGGHLAGGQPTVGPAGVAWTLEAMVTVQTLYLEQKTMNPE